MSYRWRTAAAVMAAFVLMQGGLYAQGRGRGGGPPQTGKEAAPFDPTGYWVAEITEDWKWRMVTPAKGDYQSLPLTAAAVMSADAWDPKKDVASGDQCKSLYGAPAIMRGPTRLNITWMDDNTLSVQTDYGQQTRLIHFGVWKGPGADSLQGDSVARWVTPAGAPIQNGAKNGTLEVVTTHLKPGYLRKNGVPYSANTVYTEWWDLLKEKEGDQRLLLLMQVEDPQNLNTQWIVPVHFKKEPNGSKWDPSPCSSTW